MPEDENDIILKADGSWNQVPKENDKDATAVAAKQMAEEKEFDCIDLSDEDESNSCLRLTPPSNMDGNTPLPPQPQPPSVNMIPHMPEAEIECIDLD